MKKKIVEYNGRFLGMNKVKAGSWYKTKAEVDRLKAAFLGLILEKNFPKMTKIRVEVEYWSRHDVDNLAYMTKFFVDTLVNLHKLPNDHLLSDSAHCGKGNSPLEAEQDQILRQRSSFERH